MSDYSVIITTCSCEEDADFIIRKLLDNNLAACIQTTEIKSHYKWKEEVCSEKEIIVMIKSQKDMYNEIERIILENHKYELPEIISVPVEKGYGKYLNWIDDSIK